MKHLGLFAKFWQPGQVKTRLAAKLGNELACRVYQLFLSHLLDQLSNIGHCRTIVFSPPDRESNFRLAGGNAWQTCPQSDGDLGDRMNTFFASTFERGALDRRTAQNLPETGQLDSPVRKTIVIGSDCPQLTAADIEHAFLQLDDQPVVLGPTHDGGYYLIGMRDQCFNVFDEIDWSTDRVWNQTTDRLESLGVSYIEIERKTDIDDLDNLMGYCSDLSGTVGVGDSEFVLLEAVKGVLADYQRNGGQL